MYYEVCAHNIISKGEGIECFGITAVQDGLGVVESFPDISDDYNAVSRLVRIMNEEKAEFVHIQSIIEDFFLI